jgi:hypothetical protein
LYLTCSPKVQALRFIKREIGNDAYNVALASLPKKEYSSLTEVCQDISKLPIQGVSEIARVFSENATRDEDDRLRYSKTYSFPPDLDYRNKNLYDIILETSDSSVEQTYASALIELTKYGLFKPFASSQKKTNASSMDNATVSAANKPTSSSSTLHINQPSPQSPSSSSSTNTLKTSKTSATSSSSTSFSSPSSSSSHIQAAHSSPDLLATSKL